MSVFFFFITVFWLYGVIYQVLSSILPQIQNKLKKFNVTGQRFDEISQIMSSAAFTSPQKPLNSRFPHYSKRTAKNASAQRRNAAQSAQVWKRPDSCCDGATAARLQKRDEIVARQRRATIVESA